MKRNDYSSDWMKARVSELKKEGVKYFFCETSYGMANGKIKTLKSVIKTTAQGISAYANNMYSKYGDSVSVIVTYFDDNFNIHTLVTYGA